MVSMEEYQKQCGLCDWYKQKDKNFKASLNYAKLIQNSMHSSESNLRKFLPESFLFSRAKDFIGGDFFWMSQFPFCIHNEEKNPESITMVLADCTGHGVPGALLSIAGSFILNHIVNEHGIRRPSTILNEMQTDFRKMFMQESSFRDGLDLAVIQIDLLNKKLIYSGANVALFVANKLGVNRYLSNKSGVSVNTDTNFEDIEFSYTKETCFYVTSDGYIDQFGGPDNRKFMRYRMKEMLSDISRLRMDDQRNTVSHVFENWKGDYYQTDDVSVLGFRIV